MHVALYMDAPRIGGAERHFGDLAIGLAGVDSVRVTVVSPAGVLVPYMRERLDGAAPVVELDPRPAFGDAFAENVLAARRSFGKLRATLRALDPDVVHIENGGYPGSHLARAAVFATSRPRTMTVNCRPQERRRGARSAYRLLDPLVWSRLAAIICPAQATADGLVSDRAAPRDKIRIIPYGIDQAPTDDAAVRRLREELVGDGQMLVGMVAAPSDAEDIVYKGHDVLLEALARAGRPDVVAAVVGHDPGEAFRRRVEELGVADRVVLHPGFRDAAPYMRAFDVLALPSTRNEALPLVILEAMSAGTPVLGSRLSGVPEAVVDGETGYTFDPGDVDGLSALLVRCAADRDHVAQLGRGARARHRAVFSQETMVRDTLAVLRSAVEAG